MSSQDLNASNKVGKQTCAYCLWEFTQAEIPLAKKCDSCETLYHIDCFNENEGCTVFGCPAWTARQLGVPISQVPGAMASRSSSQAQQTMPSSQTVVSGPVTFSCGTCGSVLVSDAKFCTKCGSQAPPQTPKPSFCTECGGGLLVDAKFCVGCGHPVKGVVR